MIDGIGMDMHTGRQLAGLDHIRQSCGIILNTPIGTRVARREFGSLIPALLDRPLNGKTRMQLLAATAMALRTWEPRIVVAGITLAIDPARPGAATLTLDTRYSSGPSAGRRARLQIEVAR